MGLWPEAGSDSITPENSKVSSDGGKDGNSRLIHSSDYVTINGDPTPAGTRLRLTVMATLLFLMRTPQSNTEQAGDEQQLYSCLPDFMAYLN